MSRGFYIIFTCGILISATFLYFFFKDIQFNKLNFDNLNYKFFLFALSLNLISLFFRAKKFSISVKRYSSKKFEIKSILIGSFFNLILPFRLGEIIRALYLGNKRNESRVFYFSAIIIERFFDIIFLCLFVILFLIFFNFSYEITNFNMNSFYILIFITISLLVFFILFLTNNKIVLKNISYILNIFNKKINLKLRSIIWILNLSLKEILKMDFFNYFSLSLFQWLASFLSIYFLCLSFEVALDLNSLFFLVLITYLSLMIPSGPGFVGSYQLPVLLFFISNNFSADVAYQYAFISWIFLVFIFAFIGGIISFFEKNIIFQKNQRQSQNYNKWIPSVKESHSYEKILNHFFTGNKNINFLNNLILDEKMPIVRDLGGGSSSYTILSKENNKNIVRKWSPPVSSQKLETQYEFIKSQNSKYLPKLYAHKKIHEQNTFYYDMHFYENYQKGFDYLHNNPEIDCKKLISNIANYILDFEKAETKINKEIIKKYVTEKLFNNIESISKKNTIINNFLRYEKFYLNGKEYFNYNKIKSILDLNKEKLYDDLSKYPSELCHGDVTIDNLLVSGPEVFKIVDPNFNFLNSPLIDFGKLKQSLNSGYEFLILNKEFNLKENSLNFNFNKSERYEELNKYLDIILLDKFDDSKRAILIHEAIHYARLLLYKDNIDPNKTLIYFTTMLKILNEYVEQY
jgi:uncharacterized protein (TIRG00374 family)